MDERERTARDNAIRKWSDALTVEDISGDPRDLTISIAQTMWQAGRDYALAAATASGEAERRLAICEEPQWPDEIVMTDPPFRHRGTITVTLRYRGRLEPPDVQDPFESDD